MADQPSVQRDLQALAAELKRLEAEYNMFFAGRLPRPPWETRARVEAMLKKWDSGVIETAIDRFRFQTLQTRFAKFAELWDRGQRAREEGRPGPFPLPPPKEPKRKKPEEPETRILYVTALHDPMREMDKVHSLYQSLMDARRQSGEEVVPFHRFAALVKDQVSKLRFEGTREVAFRVAMKEGKVSLTVRGLKGSGEEGGSS
jgi:hypothetical protein